MPFRNTSPGLHWKAQNHCSPRPHRDRSRWGRCPIFFCPRTAKTARPTEVFGNHGLSPGGGRLGSSGGFCAEDFEGIRGGPSDHTGEPGQGREPVGARVVEICRVRGDRGPGMGRAMGRPRVAETGVLEPTRWGRTLTIRGATRQ